MISRYVFDLDGTLCHSFEGNYEASVPLFDRIEKVNELYSAGCYIHIFTARGMSTFRGNKFLATLRWRRLTAAQLRAWNVKYHKLSLGKPSGDFYIDDKAVHSDIFFI